MKQLLISMSILVICLTICLGIVSYQNVQIKDEYKHFYGETLLVKSVKDGYATAENCYGKTWTFPAEDFQVLDIVSCVMHDNGTEYVGDDTIVSLKFSGVSSSYIWHLQVCHY